MKTVDLTRDMRPWRAGDAVHLADEVADQLVASGEAQNPRPFPAVVPAVDQAQRRGRRQSYVTKEG